MLDDQKPVDAVFAYVGWLVCRVAAVAVWQLCLIDVFFVDFHSDADLQHRIQKTLGLDAVIGLLWRAHKTCLAGKEHGLIWQDRSQ